jgi:hypothetical protein
MPEMILTACIFLRENKYLLAMYIEVFKCYTGISILLIIYQKKATGNKALKLMAFWHFS